MLSGCFLPEHPEGPSVGIRIEDGKPVLYVPLCPGEKVVSARIDDPRGDGKVLWQGSRPAHPTAKIVRFGPSDWGTQTGDFSYNGQMFGVEVEGTVRYYASGGADDRKLPADLPPDTYDLNGKTVTPAELDAMSNCDKRG